MKVSDVKCAACDAEPGHRCIIPRAQYGSGAPVIVQTLAFYHCERVDAAFEMLERMLRGTR